MSTILEHINFVIRHWKNQFGICPRNKFMFNNKLVIKTEVPIWEIDDHRSSYAQIVTFYDKNK